MTAPGSTAPAEREARAALAKYSAASACADGTFEPVRGGLSNHAWRVDADGGTWFVRLGGPESASLGVDRESERELLLAVSEAGLAPAVLACDPSNGLLVTKFVGGDVWSREAARIHVNIRRLAERLRLLHSLPLRPRIREVDFAAQARRLEVQLEAAILDSAASGDSVRASHAAQGTGAWRTLRQSARDAFDAVAGRRRQALCHNDLHHLNLLDDDSRLWLVDWEYGGRGDPLFDLASFACQHELAPAERSLLLDAYDAGHAVTASALDAACVAFDYVQWLWYRTWAERHPDADGEYAARAARLARRLGA